MDLITKNIILSLVLFLHPVLIKKKKKQIQKDTKLPGTSKNIPATRVFMKTMVLDSSGRPTWPVIDSADYDGATFILKRDTLLIEPALATQIFYIDSVTKKQVDLGINNKYLSTKENPSLYASFILENADINIDNDIKDKNGLKIEGSKETDFDFHYGLMQPPAKIDDVNQKIDETMQTMIHLFWLLTGLKKIIY